MNAEVRAELQAFYTRVDAAIAARAPRCDVSGRCCDFLRSEHRLYASDLESEYAVTASAAVAAPGAPAVPQAPSGLCPWHVEGTCRNRQGRPLGCRVYFCDPTYADEMPLMYERFHAELRAMHERHGLDYRYGLFVDAVRR